MHAPEPDCLYCPSLHQPPNYNCLRTLTRSITSSLSPLARHYSLPLLPPWRHYYAIIAIFPYYGFTGISTQHLYCPFRTPTIPLLPVLAPHCKYNPITATSTSLTVKLLSLLLLTFHSLYCPHTVSTTPLPPSLLHYPCPIQPFTTPSLYYPIITTHSLNYSFPLSP